MFRDWLEHWPEDLDLIAVAYPGRELRAREPLLTRLKPLIDAIAADMRTLVEQPLVFFGHSMGAFVAFEVARILEGHCQVIVSGACAPHMRSPDHLHLRPTHEIVAELTTLNGFPPEMLKSAELMQYFVPILHADLAACETHKFDLRPLPTFALTACAGRDDPRAGVEQVAAWKRYASSFELHEFDGDHFFIRQHVPRIVELVCSKVHAPRSADTR